MSADTTTPPVVMFNPLGPEFRADPYRDYARMRDAGPIVRTPFGALMVTRYDEIDRTFRSRDFRTPRGVADDPTVARFAPDGFLTRHRRHWILFQSGETHARLRTLITSVFTPRAVRALAPKIEALVDQLLAPALERGSMEVIRELAYPLPATVICELLGVPEADRDRNRAWAAAIAPTLDPMPNPTADAAAEEAMRDWDGYVRALMADKRRAPGDALLDAMLAAEDGGVRLTDDEVAANITFLFGAGHETTTNLIGNGLLALLRHPDQLARLRAEPSLLEGAIEELLRFDSPVQFAGRVAHERTEIAGVTIEPEVPILMALGAGNRDERRYDRADELDVGRPDVKPLSFGSGPHYCIGAALARLEARIAFSRLLERTRAIELANDHPAWSPRLTLRGLTALPVALRAAS
ncbi:MAG TPA: cytochrome P450 [Kofleriaceae bacterium]|nr:cytochrome P450 [Kofleriaceae bacterium]